MTDTFIPPLEWLLQAYDERNESPSQTTSNICTAHGLDLQPIPKAEGNEPPMYRTESVQFKRNDEHSPWWYEGPIEFIVSKGPEGEADLRSELASLKGPRPPKLLGAEVFRVYEEGENRVADVRLTFFLELPDRVLKFRNRLHAHYGNDESGKARAKLDLCGANTPPEQQGIEFAAPHVFHAAWGPDTYKPDGTTSFQKTEADWDSIDRRLWQLKIP